MSAHTPGPWELRIANGEIHAPALAAEDESTHVATMRATCVTSRWEADAHLIAAAPDMLEILKTTAENIRHLGPAGALGPVFEPYTVWLAGLEAVIAKAEGR